MQEYSVELVWDRPSQHGTHSAVSKRATASEDRTFGQHQKTHGRSPGGGATGLRQRGRGTFSIDFRHCGWVHFSRRSKIRSFLTASYEIPGFCAPALTGNTVSPRQVGFGEVKRPAITS